MKVGAQFDGDWRLVSSDPSTGKQVWHLDMGDHIVQRTDYLATDALIESNTAKANDSLGQSWGDGKVVASIPLNQYFKHFVEARREGDEKYIRKLLNDPDWSKVRTWRGSL